MAKEGNKNESLAVRHRPTAFEGVVGQDEVVDALERELRDGSAHAFLFTGPAGTGKTTLARIVAGRLGVHGQNLVEVDAASNSGVDPMRELVARTRYLGFGDNPNRAVVIDECHNLSKSAWDALLKPMEEPPSHVYFMLCTTNPSKVPATIASRCQTYRLREVPGKALFRLLGRVAQAEGMDTPDEVLERVVEAAMGSPRLALTMLATVAGADERDVPRLLAGAHEDPEAIDLCRALAAGATWAELMGIVKRLPSDNAEGTRIVVSRYFAAVAMGARSPGDAHVLLDCFHEPFNASDGMAPLVLAIGNYVTTRKGVR